MTWHQVLQLIWKKKLWNPSDVLKAFREQEIGRLHIFEMF
jgi:hypothetical protein